MVERGPEHERSAATHNGWGTGTLRSGHVYYYPVAQPTAVQFSAPVADVVRPSTTHANAAGSLQQPTTVVAQHAWNESTGADLHTDCAFEAGDELTVSECPGQWWMTGRVRGGSARERAVRFLLQNEANLRLPDSSGVTPLHRDCAARPVVQSGSRSSAQRRAARLQPAGAAPASGGVWCTERETACGRREQGPETPHDFAAAARTGGAARRRRGAATAVAAAPAWRGGWRGCRSIEGWQHSVPPCLQGGASVVTRARWLRRESVQRSRRNWPTTELAADATPSTHA